MEWGLPCASIVWSTLWSSGGLASFCCQPVELGGWRMGRGTGMFMGREQVLGWVAAGTGSCWMASSASLKVSTAFGVAIAPTGSSEWVFPSLPRLQLLFSLSEFKCHYFIYFRLHIHRSSTVPVFLHVAVPSLAISFQSRTETISQLSNYVIDWKLISNYFDNQKSPFFMKKYQSFKSSGF